MCRLQPGYDSHAAIVLCCLQEHVTWPDSKPMFGCNPTMGGVNNWSLQSDQGGRSAVVDVVLESLHTRRTEVWAGGGRGGGGGGWRQRTRSQSTNFHIRLIFVWRQFFVVRKHFLTRSRLHSCEAELLKYPGSGAACTDLSSWRCTGNALYGIYN